MSQMCKVCIIQARMASNRLPGKVLKPLAGKPVLWHVRNRVRRCRLIDEIVIATSTGATDQGIVTYCTQKGWKTFCGSEHNVLERYHEAATSFDADLVIRVTADCPLIDPVVLSSLIDKFDPAEMDYMSTSYPVRTFPVGTDCEIMTIATLKRAAREATTDYEREHVTPYIYSHPDRFRLFGLKNRPNHSNVRLTLDTQEDYDRLTGIFDRYYRPGKIVDLEDAVTFFRETEKTHERASLKP